MKARIEKTLDCVIQYEGVQDNNQQVTLSYSLRDPLAVKVQVLDVPWIFSRDLLAGRVQGLGDVMVDVGCELVSVVLGVHYADTPAMILMSTIEVQTFLMQSFALCPPGNEFYDIDSWIRSFQGSLD